MTDRLKPCPFCGGDAEVIGYYIKGVANNYQYFVHCKTCKARPRRNCTFKKKEKAIEVWNTRKPMDRIVEKLEEAKGKPYTDGVHTYNENDFIDIDKAIEIVKEGDRDVTTRNDTGMD